MCGICGIAGVEDKIAVALMSKAVSHRGPDGSGIFLDKGISLAHRRLAIIDLSARGKQPMTNEDGTVWITFNGEIYNFHALKRFLERHGGHDFASDSDTEVLVHAYEQWGDDFVSRLRGDFAFGLWDANAKKLLLARDFPGVCPLYYYHDAKTKRLYFASEIKGLLAAGVPRKVNSEAVNDFLSLQYSLGPQTLFQGIFKVQPGEMISFRKGVLKKTKYHSLPNPAQERKSEREWTTEVKHRFAHSVERRLLSDVPLGVYLSGGLDSSFTAATMKSLRDEVKTFSVDFGDDSEDQTYSKLVAETLGTDHTVLKVDASDYKAFPEVAWHLDEPAADIAALPTFLMAKQAKKHVTVILTGDGGDEVFGGYSRYIWYRKAARLHAALGPLAVLGGSLTETMGRRFGIPKAEKGGLLLREPWSGYRNSLFHFYPREVETLLRPEVLADVAPTGAVDHLDELWSRAPGPASSLLWVDEQTYLPDDLLTKMDRATMAYSLEARSPLLDHVLVEWASGLPDPLLFDRSQGKMILREAYRDVLPPEILTRRKMGFGVPIGAWMRNELRPQVEDLLLASDGPLWTWFRRDTVTSLVGRFLDGGDVADTRVWNLLALAGWISERVGRPA